MAKNFCTTGTCIPEKNYMVDLSNRIQQIINQYIESGQYFTINRARQYGKTTLLYLLEKELRKQDYLVLSLSFEAADEYFESLGSLAEGLSLDIEECLREQNVDEKVLEEWNHDRDHVHIMFRAHPKSELSKFINAYKSASSRLIKKEYPEIRQKLWKEMFWSQSFCLLSAGGAPIEVICQYIETQGENKSEHRVPFSDLPK